MVKTRRTKANIASPFKFRFSFNLCQNQTYTFRNEDCNIELYIGSMELENLFYSAEVNTPSLIYLVNRKPLFCKAFFFCKSVKVLKRRNALQKCKTVNKRKSVKLKAKIFTVKITMVLFCFFQQKLQILLCTM